MTVKFLLPFLFSFTISIIAIFFLLRTKNTSVKRLGGAVVIAVFVLTVLLNKDLIITKPIAGILVGGGLILIFGLWDDLKNIKWQRQLMFQIIIAIIVISFGVRSEFIANPFGGFINLTSPVIYFLVFTFYFLVFLNALNWLDGTDGLAGGVTLASLGTIFFLGLKPEVDQPATVILAAIAGGAVLGFLIFNFNPARILAGTSGAWFFGFILAGLSIFAGAKIATVMMAVLIPILDLARVILGRYKAGQSIFQRDKRHFHYLLLEAGVSEKKIFFLYFFASVLIGILALNLRAAGKIISIIIIVLIYLLSAREVKQWKIK